ncbi:PLP-dependent aminotransferase family protein [Mycobacterium aquaticum]|uniref:GntR family transcriptional regulator n=1 Tax=Mycobacterium aquaticum TaxID=1927124 RepID=A0A1X0B7I9_9MYCO|nr:PLP-dependent aminotransferase family protein [Mycobacterium aquaticum]ORA38179.1 GntR family transcriptional regulator [Mycobacterium aquaticum]
MRAERYKAVALEMATSIRAGDLPAGTRLPTHRELAHERGIALATATKVYRELAAAGLIVGEPGRGTFVRDLSGFAGMEPRRLPVDTRVADLSFNQPLAAEQGEHLRHALRDMACEGDLGSLLAQQPPGGRSTDTAAVATYLLDRGIDVPPHNVLLTAGAQHALDVILAATTTPGSTLVADELTYPGLKLLADSRCLDLAAVRCSPDGTDLKSLEKLARTRKISVVYVMPTVHNPLGFVLDAGRRQRLVTLARRHDFAIIEDATYAFLDPGSPAPIQTLAPERTFYVGSFSKNVATGLRAGYLVAPDPDRIRLIRALRTTTWGTSSLSTALVTRWLRDGSVTRLEKTRREDAKQRQAIARRAFQGFDYHAHPASYSGWIHLPSEIRSDQAAHRLAQDGILISTGDAFAVGSASPNAVRIALANPTIHELPRLLDRCRDALSTL